MTRLDRIVRDVEAGEPLGVGDSLALVRLAVADAARAELQARIVKAVLLSATNWVALDADAEAVGAECKASLSALTQEETT